MIKDSNKKFEKIVKMKLLSVLGIMGVNAKNELLA